MTKGQENRLIRVMGFLKLEFGDEPFICIMPCGGKSAMIYSDKTPKSEVVRLLRKHLEKQ